MFYKTVLQQRLILSSYILQITSNFRMTALFEPFTVHFETVKVGSYLRHSVHSTFHGNQSYLVSTQQHEWLHTTSQLFLQHIPRTARHSESYVIYFSEKKDSNERALPPPCTQFIYSKISTSNSKCIPDAEQFNSLCAILPNNTET